MTSAKRRLVIALFSLAAVAGLGVLVTSSRGSDDAATSRSSQGSVDGITLAGFDSPDRVELSSFRGEPLVINYWASWCLFCIEEMPDFQRVYEEVEGDVAFLGVNIQDAVAPAKELAKATGVRYPLASDPNGDIFQKLRARSMPTTVFVDEGGEIVERFSGPLTAKQLRDRIRKHFDV